MAEKTTRTPAQQKIDSQLLKRARLKRQGLSSTAIDQDQLERDSAGRVAVDISGEVTNILLDAIQREGGSVISSYPQFKALRAYLTLESLDTIAGLAEVRTISPAAKAETSNVREIQTEKSPSNSTDPKQAVAKTTPPATKKRRKHRRRHTSHYRHHSPQGLSLMNEQEFTPIPRYRNEKTPNDISGFGLPRTYSKRWSTRRGQEAQRFDAEHGRSPAG
jgi:hypothetical protein